MRKNRNLKILMLMLLLVSCGKKREASIETCFELNHSEKDTVFLSEWMIPLDLIMLETKDESLLGTIDKLIEFDERIYVLDKMRKTVLVFDSVGKYLYRIGNVGEGPGEYSALSDFSLDKTTGNVYLLTNPSEVYIYDSTGNYLSKKKISNSLLWNICCHNRNFICSSNHLTYTSGEDAFLFYYFDESFKQLNKDVSVHSEQIYSPLFVSSPFMEWKGDMYYFDNYFNMVYSFKDGIVSPDYKIGFASPMPVEYFLDAGAFMEKQGLYDYVVDISLSDDYLLIAYIHSGKHYTAIIDMLDQEIVANGVTKGMLPKMYGNEDILLSPISAELYLSYWRHLDNYLKTPVSYDDNPLVLKWKLRKE